MAYRGGYTSESYERSGFAFPRVSSVVKALIIANVVVFLVQIAFGLVTHRALSQYLGVMPSATIDKLYVWQLFTYMFLHSESHVFHIIMNMLFLYWFGTELERMLGRRRFLVLYLGGGIAGGLSYAVTQYIGGMTTPAIGASAAVMAILVVYAFYFPNRTILLFFVVPMKIKWFVLMVIGIDLVYSINTYADGVAHTAHLGGALFGFLFWRFSPLVAQLFDRLEDMHREQQVRRRAQDEKRMDEILAKIGREGFDSLTRRERDFLHEQSRRRRDRGDRG